MAGNYQMKWETIGQKGPVDVAYPLVVSVMTLPPDPNDQFVHWSPDAGTMNEPKTQIDPETLQAIGYITVKDTDKGNPISIGAQVASDPKKTTTITFEEWDDPQSNKKSKLSPVSGGVLGRIKDSEHPKFDDDTTILLKVQLTDYKGNPIPDAEVQWNFDPNPTGVSFRGTTMGGGEYPPAAATRKDIWYPVKTGSTGEASIRIGSTESWRITVSAVVPGAEGKTFETTSQPVVLASVTDETPLSMRQQVSTDAVNGVLDVSDTDSFALHVPDPNDVMAKSTWGTDEYTTFLVLEGQGEHLLFSDIPAPRLLETYWETTGILYDKSDNEKPHNTPVLFAQRDRPSPRIYSSSSRSFGTKGQITNMPPPNNPPDINRRSDFPTALVGTVNWTARQGAWISDQDLTNWGEGGLPVILSTGLPADVLDSQWYLFFSFYPNGVDNAGHVIWPKPTGNTNEFIKVGTGGPYPAVIKTGDIANYKPDRYGGKSESYLDFYLTPLTKYQVTPEHKKTWLFAGSYSTYKLST